MKPADTLRARLALWYVGALTLTLSAFALLLYGWLAQTLYRHHDAELEASAHLIAAVLAATPLEQEPIAQVLRTSDAVPRMLMVRNGRGDLIYRSPLLQVAEPTIGRHEALVHAAAHAPSDPEFFTVTLERSGLVRFICSPIEGVDAAYLQIGNPLGDVPATLHAVATASLVLVPLIVIVTSFGGWLIAGRALAPLSAIDATLRDIQATDLSQRVDVNPADRDLHALVLTINRLLGRLEHAFADLRTFAADASHQLQTPLAVMKGTIELIRRDRDSPEDASLLSSLDQEVDDLSAVIANLQTLSLADADVQLARRTEVNFSALCCDVMEILTAVAEPRHVRVEGDIQPNVHLMGDPVKLKQILLNLGDNAVKYTPTDGVVRYDLRLDGGWALVTVSDTGPGIDQADLPRIFDRFYRAASGRDRARGAGLGLAIVKRFVEVHNGVVTVASEQGAGTRFAVRLPC